jgi:hypothetical protein
MTIQPNPNIPQQVFSLFYAINWGTSANAQPRWKAFAWPAVTHDRPSLYRTVLSFILLNLVPFLYFALVLKLLTTWDLSDWNWRAFGKVFLSTLPALAPFGFYRIWTAVVEWYSRTFYGEHLDNWDEGSRPESWKDIGIHLEPSDLNPKWAPWNCLFGFAYVLFGLIVVFAF